MFRTAATSVTENDFAASIVVTPNPSTGNFFVSLPEGITTGEIKIYNMLGEEIRGIKTSASVNVSLEEEAAGIYFIKMLIEK